MDHNSTNLHVLTPYWPHTNLVLTIITDRIQLYQLHTNHILITYQPPTDHIPTTYRPHTNHIQTTYQLHTNHIPVDHIPTMLPTVLPAITYWPSTWAPYWSCYRSYADHLPTAYYYILIPYWPPTVNVHIPSTYQPYIYYWPICYQLHISLFFWSNLSSLLPNLMVWLCNVLSISGVKRRYLGRGFNKLLGFFLGDPLVLQTWILNLNVVWKLMLEL